jgi:dihydrodipicolinate reductase
VKIALLGYGKMGKLVETIAVREGWEVGPRLDIHDNADGRGITPTSMQGVDAAIEFSQPEAVLPNIKAAAQAGVSMVVGTTGWSDQRSAVQKIVDDSGIGLIYGANFSLGMNLFFEIVAHSARIVGMLPQYDAYISEAHHRAKKDAPSGTALNLLDLMRPHLSNPNLNIAVSVPALYLELTLSVSIVRRIQLCSNIGHAAGRDLPREPSWRRVGLWGKKDCTISGKYLEKSWEFHRTGRPARIV